MRLWILSDLHLEIAHLDAPLAIPDADVCIMAGDLCRGPDKGVEWLAKTIAHAMPCIYVVGNHEFYRGGLREGLAAGREAAQGFANVHFLENDLVVIDGVRFIGATLWTDYRIGGHQLMAMAHARDRMNDYRAISLQRKPWMRFTPEAAFRLHEESRTFIDGALRANHIPTVVVTHHLPHEGSVAERFKGDLLNAAFASDLSDVIEAGRPTLWVHGHSHDSCDYHLHQTRIVSNPRGYGLAGLDGQLELDLHRLIFVDEAAPVTKMARLRDRAPCRATARHGYWIHRRPAAGPVVIRLTSLPIGLSHQL